MDASPACCAAAHVRQRVIMPLFKLLVGWGGAFSVPSLHVVLVCACGLPPGGPLPHPQSKPRLTVEEVELL